MTAPRQTDLSQQESAAAAAYAIDGLRLSEVAERLGVTEGTVKSYLKRAREKFRARGVDAGSQHRLRAALLADRQETPPAET